MLDRVILFLCVLVACSGANQFQCNFELVQDSNTFEGVIEYDFLYQRLKLSYADSTELFLFGEMVCASSVGALTSRALTVMCGTGVRVLCPTCSTPSPPCFHLYNNLSALYEKL
jgi:hypothetical protein